MTKRQKLELRRHAITRRLVEIGDLDGDAYSDEARTEETDLKTELRELDPRIETAIMSEGDEQRAMAGDFVDPADRERIDLERRASVGAVFVATLEHRATDGATAELQQHLKLTPNQVPLALLREPVEARAVTPAPTNVGQNQAAIVPGVFPQSCAAFLGIDTPTVGVGEAVYPVLTTNATVHTPAENAAAADTTGSFSAEVLSPKRLQAAFFYSREDRARFMGMDEALRMNLSDALADSLDKQILAGDPNGLLHGTVLANHNRTTVADFAHYKSAFAYGRVDGTYAMGVGDIRMVVGSATYAHAATIYRANNADDDALDVLASRSGGVKVSAHVPALDSNNRQNAIIRLGSRRDMVAPIWEGVTLIPDEVTKAANGQIMVTAVMLHAVKLLRADGFYKQGTQTA